MAGTIIADYIQAAGSTLSMNVGNTLVLTANASGLTYTPTNNVNINVGSTTSLTMGNVTVTNNVTTSNVTASNIIRTTNGINFGGTTLATYTQGSFTLTTTSGWTATLTCTCYYTIVGNMVTLMVGQLYGTSNSVAAGATGLPAAIRGNSVSGIGRISPGCRMYDPGNSAAEVWGLTVIGTSGDIVWYWNANGNNWTASGSKYIDNGIVTYLATI